MKAYNVSNTLNLANHIRKEHPHAAEKPFDESGRTPSVEDVWQDPLYGSGADTREEKWIVWSAMDNFAARKFNGTTFRYLSRTAINRNTYPELVQMLAERLWATALKAALVTICY